MPQGVWLKVCLGCGAILQLCRDRGSSIRLGTLSLGDEAQVGALGGILCCACQEIVHFVRVYVPMAYRKVSGFFFRA